VVYVAAVGIFLLSGAAASAPMSSMPGRALRDVRRLVRTPAALVVAVVYLAVTAAVVVAFTQKDQPVASASSTAAAAVAGDLAGREEGETEFQKYWAAQPRVELPVPRDGARVLVVKFNDYECPSCAVTDTAYEPIFARYESSHPGAVRQLSLDYPLDPECNEQAPRGGHMGACEAAVAVRLARRAGRDAELARWLYENQQTLSRDTIREALAEVAGMTDFDELYDATLEEVKADIALGGLVQIDATPTFVINGVMIKGGLQPQFFDAAIALELERATPTP
jgi:protein-disulfide isomerase